jgi:DNA-3-methyladenine glycosylase II
MLKITDENLENWYNDLDKIKAYLISVDPILSTLFTEVDKTGFKIHTVMKMPYPALIGAIIGQKITYKQAKKLRSKLYSEYGTTFTPQDLYKKDLSYLGISPSSIIANVTNYIIENNIQLRTEDDINQLKCVTGIGNWTIETTLLTSLLIINTDASWNIFPFGDKFIQTRIKRLYGINCNIEELSSKWAPFKSVVTWYLWRLF